MIVLIYENQLPEAKAIMAQYNSKLVYSKLYRGSRPVYAISEGPIGALLTIRAQLAPDELQKYYGLM